MMGERIFRQEFLCEFGDDEDALFSSALLGRVLDRTRKGCADVGAFVGRRFAWGSVGGAGAGIGS